MRLGVLPEILKASEPGNDSEIRQIDALYKLKSKRYHDTWTEITAIVYSTPELICI